MGVFQDKFYQTLKERHPMMVRGVDEARLISPMIVDLYFEKILEWLVLSYGTVVINMLVEGYALYTLEVNLAQQQYEKRVKYEFSSFAEVNKKTYQQSKYMQDYYWGVLVILFGWTHYVELLDFYLSRFVTRISSGRLIEVAPGHGAWGLLAASNCENLGLDGWDISPTSIELSSSLANAAGLGHRCKYMLGDATMLDKETKEYDFGLCCFMLEHLENPGKFLIDFSKTLKSGSFAFISLALTAAQVDHIFEFKYESEAVIMSELAGFELIETMITRPKRLLPNAKFIPRVQAMILRKK